GFEKLIDGCFHSDGFCRESPSYSSMHLSLMENIPLLLRGYSDPPGYADEKGERFDAFDPFKHMPRYRLALESMVRMAAPNQRPPVIGDTSSRAGISPHWIEVLACKYGGVYAALLETLQKAPLEKKGGEYSLWHRPADLKADGEAKLPLRTEWFPGWHVGVLRGADPLGQTALFLNGYAYHGHRHDDTLGLIFYGGGVELASDRGYIWDDPRNAWTKCTESHNLVVVDGRSQIRKGRRSRLKLFGASPLVQVVQADANAYTQCDVYERTCVLVPLPDGQCYVVDVFRVHGGKKHSYSFQCNGELTGLGELAPAPIERKHRWLKAFRAVDAPGAFTARWKHGDQILDLRMLTPSSKLVVADAPGWRSDRGSELNAPSIQQVFAERVSTEAPLRSVYVSIIASHTGDSPIQGAELLRADDDGTVCVRVQLADRTDIVALAPDDAPRELAGMTLSGRFGFVTTDAVGVRGTYLLDGSRLAFADSSVEIAQTDLTFSVESVEGRTYVLSRPVPKGLRAAGAFLLAGDTGYEVESVAGNRIVVRDYP
ncbi:MAG: heparinase II/III family protein, partial [Lentisphaeria bacterium]|nr:heparinase II/III family protein [Lentisphaeria bacterium]